jgi:hypothetical protein
VNWREFLCSLALVVAVFSGVWLGTVDGLRYTWRYCFLVTAVLAVVDYCEPQYYNSVVAKMAVVVISTFDFCFSPHSGDCWWGAMRFDGLHCLVNARDVAMHFDGLHCQTIARDIHYPVIARDGAMRAD